MIRMQATPRSAVWRQAHLDRQMTGMLLRNGGIGRRPELLWT